MSEPITRTQVAAARRRLEVETGLDQYEFGKSPMADDLRLILSALLEAEQERDDLREEVERLRRALEAEPETAKAMLGERYLDRFQAEVMDPHNRAISRAEKAERERDDLRRLAEPAEEMALILRGFIHARDFESFSSPAMRQRLRDAVQTWDAALTDREFCRRCDDGDTDRLCTCGRLAEQEQQT